MHNHSHSHSSQTNNLYIFLFLLLILIVTEISIGIIYNSVALISDGVHVTADAIAIVSTIFALKIKNLSQNETKTYGYVRVEVLATLFNCLLLIGASFFIFYEAIHKIIYPEVVSGFFVSLIACVALAINLIGLKIMHSHEESKSSTVMKTAYLETLADAFSSIGILISGLLIYFTSIYWIDSIFAIFIGFFILLRTYKILAKTINILLESVPSHISLKEVEKELLQLSDVHSLHRLHIWEITEGHTAMSVHLEVNKEIENLEEFRQNVEKLLEQKFQINLTTIQTELI